MDPGLPSSVTTGRPAAAQASMPPSTLMGSNPSRARNSATFAERPPALQMTYSVADRSISSARRGTSPIGMCWAAAAWPRCHSSFSRTSSNTVDGPNSAGRSATAVCVINGSELTLSILARATKQRDAPGPAKPGYPQFPQVYPQAVAGGDRASLHVLGRASSARLWITGDRNQFVIDTHPGTQRILSQAHGVRGASRMGDVTGNARVSLPQCRLTNAPILAREKQYRQQQHTGQRAALDSISQAVQKAL